MSATRSPDQPDHLQHAGHSALVVPVPPLEDWVKARHVHYDRDYASSDPTFAHAHVTVLAPFVSVAELASAAPEIAEILSRTSPFAFALTSVATFPNGIIHLVPDPASAQRFRSLTRALTDAFPAYPPYAGAFDDVAPHLTLDAVGPGVTEAIVRGQVAALLPARGYAATAHLSWYEAGACRTIAHWPLGPLSHVGRTAPRRRFSRG